MQREKETWSPGFGLLLLPCVNICPPPSLSFVYIQRIHSFILPSSQVIFIFLLPHLLTVLLSPQWPKSWVEISVMEMRICDGGKSQTGCKAVHWNANRLASKDTSFANSYCKLHNEKQTRSGKRQRQHPMWRIRTEKENKQLKCWRNWETICLFNND